MREVKDDDLVSGLARETVDRMTDEQVRRVARLEPDGIALCLSREAEARLGRRGAALLRLEVARLCRERVSRAA